MTAAEPPGRAATAAQNADRVQRFASCSLEVVSDHWGYSRGNAGEIDLHWRLRSAQNPAMFNGIIHLMQDAAILGDAFRGDFVRTDFKSYLHWREQGFPETGVRDGFGSALIRTAEGHIVLGRQRAGNVNGGLAYLPGGFIDPRDVTATGAIDIDGSILREVEEETGLVPGDLDMQPGYILTFCGPLVSIARDLRSSAGSEEVRARILAHIARDPESELTDAVIVRSVADIECEAMPPYARQLLSWLLAV